MQSLNVVFSPVSYLDETAAHGVLESVIQGIKDNVEFLSSVPREKLVSMVFEMCRMGICCMKHEGFREEREWRVVYSPELSPSKHMQCSTEVIAGTPQLIYHLPLDVSVSPALENLDLSKIIDRVIIGPTQYAPAIGAAFIQELIKSGVENAQQKVWASNIPIRT
mgnify:CR=1 FL=1